MTVIRFLHMNGSLGNWQGAKIFSSVSEGAGRTIKGTEVTKVRNAVMTRIKMAQNHLSSRDIILLVSFFLVVCVYWAM